MEMQINRGRPYPLGVFKIEDKIMFAVESESQNDCGILLFTEKEEIKIPFKQEYKCGKVFYGTIADVKKMLKYQLYDGSKKYLDSYAKQVFGNETYGFLKDTKQENALYGNLIEEVFDWERDDRLSIPHEKSIFYTIHVRGFTKHGSSKVKAKGTFRGIVEKIEYLKELGITGIELMPCYEFLEAKEEKKVNYWGYKKGFYFSPKASYADGKDAVLEMKEMIKELHKAGIEVIMQFYFPKEVFQDFILDVLRHWVFCYHIDGIHLLGESIVMDEIKKDPILSNVKMFFLEHDNFMYATRKFLKGDEDMLSAFLNAMRENPREYALVNYITNYYGFTLQDLVSYDHKHNEENGEDNKDGNDYNFSWNCGIEGTTRKKSIVTLRNKQAKNAMMLLLLAQGSPMILSGDEFLNTQNGNNNAYCQDNEVGWINWNRLKANTAFLEFVKTLIILRKKTPIHHRISYHGKEAWKPAMENYNRHVGILHNTKEDFFYITINMHWVSHDFALPKLPVCYEWKLFVDTNREQTFLEKEESPLNQQEVEVMARSIQIYKGVKSKKK